MPVPKKRHSNVRQGKRRFANYRLRPASLSRCPNCGNLHPPHQACPNCGQFKGRQVIKLKAKKEKGKKA
ncbi:MAG: 50S ribosomal protein L32 [Candidatus Saganbacteria bacterium]|nr:50S ribosomal protein L32 [Candidatus Saganbacteria bacterium]